MKHSIRIFVAWLLASTAAFGQYRAYDLGTLGTLSIAYGINNSGTIVGSYDNSDIPPEEGIETHAFVYQNGVMSDLGSLGGGYSEAHAVNDQGVIVGDALTADNDFHAFSYQDGVMTDLGTFSDNNSDFYLAVATNVNNKGTIVGWSTSPYGTTAFSYQNGIMSYLASPPNDNSYAYGINDQGVIVGASTDLIDPVSWQNGVMSDLGSLGGTGIALSGPFPSASGINDKDTIVGWATTNADAGHAFSYTNGVMSDLGTLGGSNSFARGINNQGTIVGYSNLIDSSTLHAFVYQNGVMTDLNPYLETIGMVGNSYAMAINDLGEIVGEGGNGHAFLLVPAGVAPPPVAAPTFNPAAGAYPNVQLVTITSVTPGTAIRYTTDGNTPSETNGIIYSGPVSISMSTTLRAIAYETGFSDSSVTTAVYTLALPPAWAVRDFDGDGGADIAWYNSNTGGFGIWTMNGTTPKGFTPMGNLPPRWDVVAVGDFNHDGKADILCQNNDFGLMGILLMNGTSPTNFITIGGMDPTWTVAGLGDFNHDGQTDILWQNTSGALGFWSLNGTIVNGFTGIGILPAPWTVAGVGDFNGDGKSDLLLFDPTTGDLAAGLMDGSAITGLQGIGTLPAPWTVAGVADFNGDGWPDLLVQDTGGDLGILTMTGTTLTGFSPVGNVPAPWRPKD